MQDLIDHWSLYKSRIGSWFKSENTHFFCEFVAKQHPIVRVYSPKQKLCRWVVGRCQNNKLVKSFHASLCKCTKIKPHETRQRLLKCWKTGQSLLHVFSAVPDNKIWCYLYSQKNLYEKSYYQIFARTVKIIIVINQLKICSNFKN